MKDQDIDAKILGLPNKIHLPEDDRPLFNYKQNQLRIVNAWVRNKTGIELTSTCWHRVTSVELEKLLNAIRKVER